MKIELNLRGIDGVLKTLQQLPAEVASKRGGPVALALAKGARLIRDEARKNLRASIARNGEVSTGLLEKSVIASRGKAPIGHKGERYLVRVKRKAYDGQKLTKGDTRVATKSRKRVTTLQTANLLEYGSVHQPATPWLRPAVHTKGGEAIDVMTKDLTRRIDLVVTKLRQKNSR